MLASLSPLMGGESGPVAAFDAFGFGVSPAARGAFGNSAALVGNKVTAADKAIGEVASAYWVAFERPVVAAP